MRGIHLGVKTHASGPGMLSAERGDRTDMGVAARGAGHRLRVGRLGGARGAHGFPAFRLRVVYLLYLLGAASQAEAERVGRKLRAWVFVHLAPVVVRTGHVRRAEHSGKCTGRILLVIFSSAWVCQVMERFVFHLIVFLCACIAF